jgi:hypothetical protein
MPYEYTITIREAYVVMALAGPENLADNKASVLYAKQVCSEHGKDRLLVDLRDLSGRTSVIENYEFAAFLAETFWPNVMRLATIYSEKNEDVERFLETAGRNRGLQIRAFSTMEAADAWLVSFSSPAD